MTPTTLSIITPVLAMVFITVACLPLASIAMNLTDSRDYRPAKRSMYVAPRRVRRSHEGAHRLTGLAPGQCYARSVTAELALYNRGRKRPGLTRTERRGIAIA